MSLFSRVKSCLLYTKIVLNKIFSRKYDIRNMNEFGLDCELLCIYTKKDFINIQVNGMIDLWEAVVDNTPVDLGLAQNNWQLGEYNNGSILYKEILDKREAGDYYKPAGTVRDRIIPYPETPNPDELVGLDRITLFNNIPYIDSLEAGSSPKAGAGKMLSDNKQKMEIEIKKKLKETGMFK